MSPWGWEAGLAVEGGENPRAWPWPGRQRAQSSRAEHSHPPVPDLEARDPGSSLRGRPDGSLLWSAGRAQKQQVNRNVGGFCVEVCLPRMRLDGEPLLGLLQGEEE